MALIFREVFISKAALLSRSTAERFGSERAYVRALLHATYKSGEFHYYQGREPHEAPEVHTQWPSKEIP